MLKNGKAQSLAEYAIILAIIVAALLAMQLYFKRGLQGRIHDMANQVSPRQYIPGEGSTSSNYITQTQQVTQERENGAQ
jgi:hypothetical protein